MGPERSTEMQKRIKPIDVFVGEANDGHAELVEASLQDIGIVNTLYRGRDGRETLALVRQAWRGHSDVTVVPSLILLDWGLPRVGGLGALKALKGDRRCSWIPVIMMTTANNRQQAEQCRRLGCEAYITKWTVFLGLPDFVSRIRVLADSDIRIASDGSAASRSYGCRTGTLEPGSMYDTPRICRHRQELIGKEVKDGSATS